MVPGVQPTLGSLLIGTLVSLYLSGVLSMQAASYFKNYSDTPRIKLIVALIWGLDLFHTIFSAAANWDYLIEGWGNDSMFEWIPWTLAVTVAITAVTTFLVQCFFAYRVYIVSRQNAYVAAPIAFLALLRVVAAIGSTAEMIILQSFEAFRYDYGWVFTLGLSLSSAVDILVTCFLCYYLDQARTGFQSMDMIINILTVYTVQNGLLTCITTVVALICWVVMPNLIFLGLHLTISKLYANSLLATLNGRRSLRDKNSSVEGGFAHHPRATGSGFRSGLSGSDRHYQDAEDIPMSAKPLSSQGEVVVQVQIDVQRDFEPDDSDEGLKPDSRRGITI